MDRTRPAHFGLVLGPWVDMLARSCLMTWSDRAKFLPILQALAVCPFPAKQVAWSCLMARANRAVFLPSSLVLLPRPFRYSIFGPVPVWTGGPNWLVFLFFWVDMLARSCLMTRSDRAKFLPIPQALAACPCLAKQVARVNRSIFLPSSLVLLPRFGP